MSHMVSTYVLHGAPHLYKYIPFTAADFQSSPLDNLWRRVLPNHVSVLRQQGKHGSAVADLLLLFLLLTLQHIYLDAGMLVIGCKLCLRNLLQAEGLRKNFQESALHRLRPELIGYYYCATEVTKSSAGCLQASCLAVFSCTVHNKKHTCGFQVCQRHDGAMELFNVFLMVDAVCRNDVAKGTAGCRYFSFISPTEHLHSDWTRLSAPGPIPALRRAQARSTRLNDIRMLNRHKSQHGFVAAALQACTWRTM